MAAANLLSRAGVGPNAISLTSIAFAIIGAGLLAIQTYGTASCYALLGAAVCVQLRLMANMLDGMVAIEAGRQTPIGELYNEVPDRIADVLFLAAAGYAAGQGELGIALGWISATAAIMTAYIRALGAHRGWNQDFCGPQAKPHRMFVLTVGLVLAAVEKSFGYHPIILAGTLAIIALGTVWTCIRRTHHMALRMTHS